MKRHPDAIYAVDLLGGGDHDFESVAEFLSENNEDTIKNYRFIDFTFYGDGIDEVKVKRFAHKDHMNVGDSTGDSQINQVFDWLKKYQ